MKKTSTLFFAVLLTCINGFSQIVLISENFTSYQGTVGTAPSGWYFSSHDNYTSTQSSGASGPNSYQFGVNGATVIPPSFTNADSVHFWVRGNGTSTASAFYLFESTDSVSWDTITAISPLPATQYPANSVQSFPVKVSSKWLKFYYFKDLGNVAFDDFLLTGLEPVTANFSAPDVCLGDSTCFTDLSATTNGTIVSWQWDFGNGDISVLSNPCILYTSDGTYNVKLIVTNSSAESDTIIKTVSAGATPTADFMPIDSTGCSPLGINYMDMSAITSGTISSYEWDFGDGNTSSAQHPTHTFSAGTFTVSLVVTSDFGCTDTAFGTAIVFENPQIDTSAVSITNPDCGASNGSITGISVSGNSPFSYMWMPGMQTSVDLQNASSGNYDFSVSDVNGCVSSLNFSLVGTGAPAAPSVPNADTTYCDGENIASLIASTGTGIVWYSDSSLTDTLQTGASYTPDLNLGLNYFYVTQTSSGCQSPATTVTITVNALPVVSFTADTNAGCAPLCVNFANTTANTVSCNWNFGDGNNSANCTAANCFSSDGTYTTTLIVIDNNGCSNTKNIVITVHPLPSITASPSAPSYCAGGSVSITASGASTYSWAPATGLSATTGATVTASPTATTTYTVTGTSGAACTNTTAVTVTVNPKPVAGFTYIQPICEAAQFTDTSSGNIVSWLWNFGDGDTSTMQNPTHLFIGWSFYNISLTVTNVFGCTDTFALDSTLIACEAIDGNGFSNLINVSPNPSNGKFSILIKNEKYKNQITKMEVKNILGEIVSTTHYSTFNAQYSLELNQPEGTYFLTIISGEEIATKKIVIVR